MIKIFVVCHKPAYVLKNDLLIPVQVGAAAAKERIPGMEYDDNGDNISAKNPWYCELTAQYWAWKNVDAEYYGFFHYRRYLSFGKVYPVRADGMFMKKEKYRSYFEVDDIRENLDAYCLEPAQMEAVIRKYELVTVLRERINTTVYRQYVRYHGNETLDSVIQILKKRYPEYGKAADAYLNSKEIYYMNMFIMKKELFCEYGEWLFSILGEYEKSEEFQGLGEKKARLMGFLAERLFGIFYTYKRSRGTVCAEVPYLKFYNTEINGFSGVSRNIRKIRLGSSNIEIPVDMKKVNRLFPAGSKRRLILRGIFLK